MALKMKIKSNVHITSNVQKQYLNNGRLPMQTRGYVAKFQSVQHLTLTVERRSFVFCVHIVLYSRYPVCLSADEPNKRTLYIKAKHFLQGEEKCYFLLNTFPFSDPECTCHLAEHVVLLSGCIRPISYSSVANLSHALA